MTIYFSELRHPQIKEAAKKNAVVVLPFGQIEEHGPHLPIYTDAFIAERVCEDAIKQLAGNPPSYMLEPISYGYSQKVLKKWPGTFSLPQQTVVETLKHILLSLTEMGIRKCVVVSTHGNHRGVARMAAREVADECGAGPALFFPVATVGDVLNQHGQAGPGGSCHAGETETSLMLYLAPDLVEMSVAVADDKVMRVSPYPLSQAFISTWTCQTSSSGAYGDPTVATAELGKLLFDRMVSATAEFIRYYQGMEQI